MGDEIVPDLNFRLQMADGEKRLFTFEYHRGKDAGKILRQLEQHVQALRDGVLSERYKHPYSHFVLSVYEHPNVLENATQRLNALPRFEEDFGAHFLFNTIDEMKADFPDSWRQLDGSQSSRFS